MSKSYQQRGGESETEKAHFDERRSKSRVGGGRQPKHDQLKRDEFEESQGQDKVRQSTKSLNRRRDHEREVTDTGKERSKKKANRRAGGASSDRSLEAVEQDEVAMANSSEERQREQQQREYERARRGNSQQKHIRSYSKSQKSTKSRPKRYEKQIDYSDEEDEEEQYSEDRSQKRRSAAKRRSPSSRKSKYQEVEEESDEYYGRKKRHNAAKRSRRDQRDKRDDFQDVAVKPQSKGKRPQRGHRSQSSDQDEEASSNIHSDRTSSEQTDDYSHTIIRSQTGKSKQQSRLQSKRGHPEEAWNEEQELDQSEQHLDHSIAPDKDTSKLLHAANNSASIEAKPFQRRLTVVELKRFGLPMGEVRKEKMGEEFARYSTQKSTKHMMDTGLKAKKKKVNCLTLLCQCCSRNGEASESKQDDEFNEFTDLGFTKPPPVVDEGDFFDQFMIPQDNWLLNFWNGFIIFLDIFSSLIYLYLASFRTIGVRDPPAVLQTKLNISYGIECCFLFDMILMFFKEFTPEDTTKPVTSFQEITEHYVQNQLIIDIIPIIPLQLLTLHRQRERLFYLLKFQRLFRGMKVYSRSSVMKFFKNRQMATIRNTIANDHKAANDKILDRTKNEQVLFISFFVRLLELIVLIFLCSYLFCFFWIIMCEAYEDFWLNAHYRDMTYKLSHELPDYDNFIPEYQLQNEEQYTIIITVFYYAFTSLTTVGFGDKRPFSTIERLFTAFMLFGGVLIFSYIIGVYGELLSQYEENNADYDEGERLQLFFGVLKKFNDNEAITIEFQKQIEDYFTHRWENHRTLALEEAEGPEILDQIFDVVQLDLFSKFLYEPFLKVFHRTFSLAVPKAPNTHTYFSFDNPVYSSFMVSLMKRMEPRFDHARTIVYGELDEVTEVILYLNGKFDIGFEVNSKSFFALRYSNKLTSIDENQQLEREGNAGEIIGDFGCTMNKTSRFIYRCATLCDGFFIRKSRWVDVMNEHSFVAKSLKAKICQRHARQVVLVERHKKCEIEKFQHAAHIDQYKFLRNDADVNGAAAVFGNGASGAGANQDASASKTADQKATAGATPSGTPNNIEEQTANGRHGGHEDEDHELKNQTDHLKSHLEDELPRICAEMFTKYENSIHKIDELENSNEDLLAEFESQDEYIAKQNQKIERLKAKIEEAKSKLNLKAKANQGPSQGK